MGVVLAVIRSERRFRALLGHIRGQEVFENRTVDGSLTI